MINMFNKKGWQLYYEWALIKNAQNFLFFYF